MHIHLVRFRRVLLVTIVGAVLTACGGAPTPGSPVASTAVSTPAVAATTALNAATASPAAVTVEPAEATPTAPSATDTPAATETTSVETSVATTATAASDATAAVATGVLPQPLLFSREGQIVRLERDGTTVTPITAEQPGQADILAVTTFDVSPVDGSLVYIVQASEGNDLVRTDANGQQRTVLVSKAGINNPVWSPDGTQIALQFNPPLDPAAGPAAGVYVLPANGGEPTLIQPFDPSDPANPDPEARHYAPYAWSPDGKRLLLSAYAQGVEVCNSVVKNLETGDLVPIQAPEGMVSGCAGGQWSPDGREIYINMARPGPQPPVPGLWQADPTTGAVTPFIQGEFENGFQLVSSHRPLADGSVYAFHATVSTLPEPFGGGLVQYKLFQGSQTDGLFLRDETFPVTGQALWAPDNSGVVADLAQEGGDVMRVWIPIDGGPVVELGTNVGEEKEWAAGGS